MIASPLRYPGGKARLFNFFSALITHNGLLGAHYLEPYAGGAGLALKLLTCGFVNHLHLNDLDPAIYAFWNSALFETDRFCEAIERTPISIDEWYRQRQIWREADHNHLFELGFSAYYLNRTNRSGIIEGAGPVGGYAQKGLWKLDARFPKLSQIVNLQQLGRYRRQVSLSNNDATDFLKRPRPGGSLLYLDPPYYIKGRKLYKNFYSASDHASIAQHLRIDEPGHWVVSYDDVPQIADLYSWSSPTKYKLPYSAGPATTGNEVIYLSNNLTMPATTHLNVAA